MAKLWAAVLGWSACTSSSAFSGEQQLSSSSSGSSSGSARPDTSDYRSLLLNGAPMMDVRSPVEFDQGSFPSATNRPLMTNDERHRVGICYKEDGQDAAIALGHALVTGEVKRERMEGWAEFCRANPETGYLYCFRGGLRSNTVQDWILEETGVRLPLVTGGYKAMRRFLLDELDRSLDERAADLVIICGRTGTGKTKAISELKQWSVDLEGLAHHRGSSFGRGPEDYQPRQIDFENSVSLAFLKTLDQHNKTSTQQGKPRVFVEDESRRIGGLSLPHVLGNRMKASDGIVIVEESMESRLDLLVDDYCIDLRQRFVALLGDEMGRKAHSDHLLDALYRIRKKLGGDRHADVLRAMTAALVEQDETNDLALHRLWIATLLEEYYDPMYDYGLSQRKDRVLFQGSREAVIEWARDEALKQ